MGGRGATSNIQKKVNYNLPDGLSKSQKRVIENIKSSSISQIYGSRYEKNYEIKEFEVDNNNALGHAFLSIEIGRKGDEGTYGEIIGRDRAFFVIGKNGGLRHFRKGGSKPVKTKILMSAFVDYARDRKRK